MTLREKINEQFNTALKSKNKTSVSTFRLILAAIKEYDIKKKTEYFITSGKGKKEQATDQQIIKVLQKMKKQRQDSADLYKKGERPELLAVEEAEIKIIDTFLPKQLSEEETKKICTETVSALGATSIKDMGKVMGELKKKYADILDFAKAGSLLKELLSK